VSWSDFVVIASIGVFVVTVILAGTAWQIWVAQKVAGHVLKPEHVRRLNAKQRRLLTVYVLLCIRILNAVHFRSLAQRLERVLESDSSVSH
jgi:predicted RND superfamily exporter protein